VDLRRIDQHRRQAGIDRGDDLDVLRERVAGNAHDIADQRRRRDLGSLAFLAARERQHLRDHLGAAPGAG
jgi:hypothetical protein